MSYSLAAIVTGGAQGIGAAICTELLKNGYRVCVADIQETKAEEFAKQQQNCFGEETVTSIHCDVTKESDISNVFEHTLKFFKRVDVLVNNAGIELESDPRKCLEVNLLGPIFGCHAALKYMGKSNGGNGGVVINTASIAGFKPLAGVPAYTASKHGIVGLTRSFGLPFYYDKEEIIFSAICPGLVETDLVTTHKSFKPTAELMSPEFVAKGVMKIIEDKINGSTLLVISNEYYYEELAEKFKKLKL